jgi:hypothetical protein
MLCAVPEKLTGRTRRERRRCPELDAPYLSMPPHTGAASERRCQSCRRDRNPRTLWDCQPVAFIIISAKVAPGVRRSKASTCSFLVPSRVVAQRGAFRAGWSPVGLLADRGRSFAAWGRCAAPRAFLPAGGLASGRRSGRRTMAAGWGNAAGVCGAAVWVAAPSRLAPCVRSTVVVTELGYRFPRFRWGPRVSGPLAVEERPVGTDVTGAAFRLHEAKETVRPGHHPGLPCLGDQ